jgi:uncharacterized protein (TIGR00661 family)
MRIAYGVHGYGRGHAARSLAVLTHLSERHEVQVFTGGDAEPLLSRFPTSRIPCLVFGYRGAHLSALRTLRENAGLLSALALGGGPVAAVERALVELGADAVVSDSEPLVLHAARRLGIPRVGLDHVGVLAWCRPAAPLADALALGRDGFAYRLLMGRPDRVVVSSFFGAPPRRPDVTLVPPVLRERVLHAAPRDAGHLLVYFNQRQLLTPEVLAAISGAGVPAIVYNAGREGRAGQVVFKRIDEAAFVEDLATARAVLSTAGHQLASEALHLGKPMLLCPEESAEQRLNARELVRLGVSRCLPRRALTAAAIRAFLDGLGPHLGALARVPRDGNARAVAALEGHLRALTGGRTPPGTARGIELRRVARGA